MSLTILGVLVRLRGCSKQKQNEEGMRAEESGVVVRHPSFVLCTSTRPRSGP